MASLTDIRSGLKTTISAAIPALHCYNTVPEVTNLPALVTLPVDCNFDGAMGRGTDTYEIDLYVLVSRRDDSLAQAELDTFVTGAGSSSIRQAIFNARALGLTGTDAHVTGMSRYGATFDVGEINNLGAVLRVQVHTTGTA